MKIDRVQAWALDVPVDFSEIGILRQNNTQMVFAEVETNDGIIGHGISSIADPRPIANTINEVLGPKLVGMDPMDHEKLWHHMFWNVTPWGQTGYASHAISAVDLAIWDLKGIHLDLPVWRLIGGARNSLEIYATCGFSFLDDDQLVESVSLMAEAGFRGAKIQVGRPGQDTRGSDIAMAELIKNDARRIGRVREALGVDFEIAVDAGCRLDISSAYDLCLKIADYEIAWFEEPIIQNDVRLLSQLRSRQPIKLTAGQNEGLAYRFRDMLTHGSVDMIQPNMIITGGLTQCLRIAGLADAFNTSIGNGGGCPFHNMHLQAGLQVGTNLEYQVNAVNACKVIFKNLPKVDNGYLKLPHTPGLGLEPNKDAIRDCIIK
ncbi:MAG: mandelate racemase/muconate lactonizing enzyme family protein [Alphaproteobacteria bacterium]